MMDAIPFKTRKDQRVKLQGFADHMYEAAYANAPGWVRKQKRDNFGYPMVFIEWDKRHWSYNGEEDRWALEAHFEPVEEPMNKNPTPPNGGLPPEVIQALANWALTQQSEQTSPESRPEPETREPTNPAEAKSFGTTNEKYLEILSSAMDHSAGAEAVMILTVTSKDTSQGPAYTPRLFQAYKTPVAGLLLEMQLSKIAMNAHQDAGWMALSLLGTSASSEEEG